MEETRYGLRVDLPVPYTVAIERATAALKAQGFGVLTTIDVRQTLKQKLDRDFRPYVILQQQADLELSAQRAVGEHGIARPQSQGTVVAIPEVGGLHHRYERRAA